MNGHQWENSHVGHVIAHALPLIQWEQPPGGTWLCGECSNKAASGVLCPDCGAVICDHCDMADPSGHKDARPARRGLPCPRTP